MKFMKMTAVAVLGVLLFAGCGAKKDRTEKKLGPAESITHLAKSTAEGDAFQAWASLPKSWRTDINGVANLIGEKMPDTVWDKTFVIVGRLGGIFETKAQMLFDMIGGELPPKMTKEDVLASIKDLGKVLTTIAKSKIATVKSLKTVDLADFAEGAGSTILKMISANKLINESISQQSKDGKISSFKDVLSKLTAKLISEEGNTAKVLLTLPEGKAEKVEMTKVEGKWLQTDMVTQFTKNMPKMKEELGKQLDEFAKESMMAAGILGIADGVVASLENAKTADDMKKVLARLPFKPMSLLGSLLGQGSAKAAEVKAKSKLESELSK